MEFLALIYIKNDFVKNMQIHLIPINYEVNFH